MLSEPLHISYVLTLSIAEESRRLNQEATDSTLGRKCKLQLDEEEIWKS